MATAVVMPKLGNSVESSIIASWRKKKGDTISTGEVLCDIETDKATMDVESPASGTVLETFFDEGDDVPVLTNIAAIGEPGENVDSLRPTLARLSDLAPVQSPSVEAALSPASSAAIDQHVPTEPQALGVSRSAAGHVGISPRARHLAQDRGLDTASLVGTGPGGRIIERDVRSALAARPKMTPLAKSMVASGDFVVPPGVSAPRITSKDLTVSAGQTPLVPGGDDVLEVIPLKGPRKLIAARMLASMQTTAQLTLNASADARKVLDYRKQLKSSPEGLGLRDVTINDLVLFVVSRTLLQFLDLNSLFVDETITRYRRVHLGFAVDMPRGLIVPVIRNASQLSLGELSKEAKRLTTACQDGTVQPDELNGATFTVTNLGSLGIESFTPILNPPQVAILGVGNVNLKPIDHDGEVAFIPHLSLSLTINHQVVDGAPGARFLQALATNLAKLELLLAL